MVKRNQRIICHVTAGAILSPLLWYTQTCQNVLGDRNHQGYPSVVPVGLGRRCLFVKSTSNLHKSSWSFCLHCPCGALDETGPTRLTYLNSWFPVDILLGRIGWQGFARVDVSLRVGFKVSKAGIRPSVSLPATCRSGCSS